MLDPNRSLFFKLPYCKWIQRHTKQHTDNDVIKSEMMSNSLQTVTVTASGI